MARSGAQMSYDELAEVSMASRIAPQISQSGPDGLGLSSVFLMMPSSSDLRSSKAGDEPHISSGQLSWLPRELAVKMANALLH